MKKYLPWLSLWLSVFAVIFALFNFSKAHADVTLKLGTLLDDDDGGLRMVTLAGDDRSGLALNFGQTWHDPGIDDGDNEFLGVDWFVKFNHFRFAIGGSYWSDPLHLTSERLNAHLEAAFVYPVNRWITVGGGIDHWSNCRRICNHRVNEIRNDPRNAISASLGLVF